MQAMSLFFSWSIYCYKNSMPIGSSSRPLFMQDLAQIVFTTAAPIMVQFGSYGYLIAIIGLFFGFIIEFFVLYRFLRLPYKFIATRLMLAHILSLFFQIITGFLIFGLLAVTLLFGFMTSFKNQDVQMLYQYSWLLLVVTLIAVLFVVITNMIMQYKVFCWQNSNLSKIAVRKAVIYANLVSYVMLLVILIAVNHFTTLFKDVHAHQKQVKTLARKVS